MEAESLIQLIFGVLGGLGIFLLGMKNMSEGMQAVAGAKLRRMVNAVTNNRLVACGVGTLMTCLVQSSSVTTVMAVGMVNAGIMNLMQAIGVILGANIGTTITGWILVLKVGKYGLPLLGISALIYLFTKYERVRYIAMLFMGVGMVFFGLQLMKEGFEPLRTMPGFVEWFSKFEPSSYFGVIKCVLVGAALTAIVQSSSATLGITMGLAYNGLIGFEAAAALVLGENIGTTVTAFLASRGASVNAKRAAYAHIMINVSGVLWITAIFGFYVTILRAVLGVDPTTEVLVDGAKTFPYALKGIALSHTGFNVVNTLVMLPLMPLLARLLQRIVPEKKTGEQPHLTFLDVRMVDTPAIGIQQSWAEVLRMARSVDGMMDSLQTVLEHKDGHEAQEQAIFAEERTLDIVQKETVEFLSHLLSGNVPHTVMDNGRRQLRMADEYESISDYITNVLKLNLKLADSNLEVSPAGKQELLDMHRHVWEYLRMINRAVKDENPDVIGSAETQAATITHVMKEYRSKHLARVENREVSPLKSLAFTDMLTSYRRIKDHALNIAEVLSGEK